MDEMEKLIYELGIDASGFEKEIDAAMKFASKKERELMKQMMSDLSKMTDKSNTNLKAITDNTLSMSQKVSKVLGMSMKEADSYVVDFAAKFEKVGKAALKEHEKRSRKTAATTKKRVKEEVKTEEQGLNEILGIMEDTGKKKVKVAEKVAKDIVKAEEKVEQAAEKKKRGRPAGSKNKSVKDNLDKRLTKEDKEAFNEAERKRKATSSEKVYTPGATSATNPNKTLDVKPNNDLSINGALKRFIQGDAVRTFYEYSQNGAMHTGSPMFKGDPQKGGWASGQPRLENTGPYKMRPYMSQHPDTRMSKAELGAHLVKLNHEKRQAKLERERFKTREEMLKWQDGIVERREAREKQATDAFKKRVKDVKSKSEDFYKSFAEMNGMKVEDAKAYIKAAQRNTAKTKSTGPINTGHLASAANEVIATKDNSVDNLKRTKAANGSVEGNSAVKILTNIQRILQKFLNYKAENRVEPYYNNKEAAENAKLNKKNLKGKRSTSAVSDIELQAENQEKEALKFVRNLGKYSKTTEEFEQGVNRMFEIIAGASKGMDNNELIANEVDLQRGRVKDRTDIKAKTEQEMSAERHKAAAELIQDAIRTSKSLDEFNSKLEYASKVQSGEEQTPDRYARKYDAAVQKAQQYTQGVKLPTAKINEKLAKQNQIIDPSSIEDFKKRLGSIKGTFAYLKKSSSDFFRGVNHDAEESSKKVYNYFKSATRIASGILISQAFYTAVNAIKIGIGSVVEFNTHMEDTQVAFEQLLGSAKASKAMMMDLENLAAKTPYSVETAVDGATKMLAFGFKAKEIIPTLSKLADATAIAGGDSAKMERLILALGQIKVKGKLAGEELRQLYEAGIPAADIMMKKLNLTRSALDKQVRKGAISANVAISALLEGIEERFGGTAKKLNRTVKGLFSNIKDSSLYIGQMLTGGLHEALRSTLETIADGLEVIMNIARAQGPGGVINAIFPKEYQNDVRRFVAYLGLIGKTIKSMFVSSGALKSIFLGFLRGATAYLGVLSGALKLVDRILKGLSSHLGVIETLFPAIGMMIAAKMLFGISSGLVSLGANLIRLTGLTGAIRSAGVIMGSAFSFISGKGALATKTLEGFGVATKFLVANPIVAIVGTIAAAVLLVGKNADRVRLAINNLSGSLGAGGLGKVMLGLVDVCQIVYLTLSKVFKRILDFFEGMFGIDINKILQPIKQLEDDPYGDIAGSAQNAADDLDDAAEDAKKANEKFLASFDEVFQVPEKDEDDNGGGGSSGLDNGGSGGSDSGGDVTPAINTIKWPEWPPLPPLPPVPAFKFPEWPQWPKFPQLEFAPVTEAISVFIADVAERLQGLAGQTSPVIQGMVDKWKEAFNSTLPQMTGALGIATGDWNLVLGSFAAAGLITLGGFVAQGLEMTKGFGVDVSNAFSDFLTRNNVNVGGLLQGTTNIFRVAYDNINKLTGGNLEKIRLGFQVYLGLITGNVGLFVNGLVESFKIPSVKEVLDKALEGLKWLWENHKGKVLLVVSGLTLGIAAYFLGVPALIGEGIVAGGSAVIGAFQSWGPKIMEWANQIPTWFRELGPNIGNSIKSWAPSIAAAFKGLAPKLSLPAFNLPDLLGGFSFKLPDIVGNLGITGFANGGVIDKDSIIRAGEGGRREAVVPLESGAMNPFADAVAMRMQAIIGSQRQTQTQQPLQPLYVGTLIADERSLKELERKMQIIRYAEKDRRG